MTRFNNPLAPSQVPNTQGRPAGSPQHQQPQQYAQPQQGQPQPSQHGDIFDHLFGGAQGASRGERPAAPGYSAETGYGDPRQVQPHRDAYAALRPDGYGYAQPAQPQQQPVADPYGLAGYTAPQAAPSFGTRAPQAQPQAPAHAAPAQQPGYDGYAGDPFAGSFGAAGQPGGGYGHAAQPTHQPSLAPQTQGYGAGYQPAPAQAQGHNQWGAQQGFNLDPHDYNRGYAEQGLDAQGQWNGQQGYGDGYGEPSLGGNGGYAPAQQGHQGHQGSFDQSYAEDDAQYDDAPRGRSWKKMAAVMACTVFVGVGIASAYGSLFGPSSDEPTPVVKGAANPTKVKPSEPGGKQFAHTDSKIMGRLSEGETSSTDPAGVKKVPIVTVGRDGQIQAPSASEETRAVVAVPGLTVIDGLGGGNSGPTPNRPVSPTQQAAPAELVKAAEDKANAAAAKKAQASPVLNAKADANDGPAALPTKQATVLNTPTATPKAEPKAEPKKQRVAALTDDAPAAAAAPAGPKPTGAGYVAVLASVPASGSSRMDALTQFADMQQKYGGILKDKTPDIREADLGAKGTYHRLMVGPPGSRDSATSVCTQLKAEGYSGCWVTAY
ncbi:MAG: SPOR domain-containing protein [Hyphomicrobium sp.]|jgi:hypothetical protein|uniref:SPOR domain-containing protein n=2 Tax=Hyphomicrobium TaxID=81 RepID=UPI0025C2E6C5|nr:SPOR domain-containing protein [Hyphomicrobium sp.]MBX9862574.1 SPOR domain-containing protein [Hyphomicrobium sp.]